MNPTEMELQDAEKARLVAQIESMVGDMVGLDPEAMWTEIQRYGSFVGREGTDIQPPRDWDRISLWWTLQIYRKAKAAHKKFKAPDTMDMFSEPKPAEPITLNTEDNGDDLGF